METWTSAQPDSAAAQGTGPGGPNLCVSLTSFPSSSLADFKLAVESQKPAQHGPAEV